MKMKDIMDAQRDEMLRHKWIESEKAGYDLGDPVMVQWTKEYGADWRTNFNFEHLMELPESGRAIYFGIFLDLQSTALLAGMMKELVPLGWDFKCARCTLAFGDPASMPEVKEFIAAKLGSTVTMRIKTLGVSDDAIAVGVEGDFKSMFDMPHIPVAVPPGGHSKNSNSILKWEAFRPDIELRGTVDTFPRMFG